MQTITLGDTGITVSDWCLGTMTMPTYTPPEDAHRQIDTCLEHGINFIDTAEMYPVNPIRKETAGQSEECIGDWVQASGRRQDVVIATKVTGPNGGFMRDGKGYNGATVRAAVDASLKRLKTDYIDLYQLHWPDRGSYAFRQNWNYNPSGQNKAHTLAHMADVLEAISELVKEGKLRAFGLSNESAWGTTQWITQAERMGAPKVVSVQNEYSLMCRLYDTDMAEMSVNEDVALLSFSPLACGLLSGKYEGGKTIPEGSRYGVNPSEQMGGRFASPRTWTAVQAYLDIANTHGLDPLHMAMAWQRSRPFKVSAIFGCTHYEQLEHLLKGKDLVLGDEVLADISAAHRAHPMPY